MQVSNPATNWLSTPFSLTAAQVLTLHSAPVIVVPAPGANRLLVCMAVYFQYNFGTVAYHFTTGASDGMQLYYTVGVQGTTGNFAGTVSGSSSQWSYAGAFPGPYAILPGADNTALTLQSVSDYTNGPIATATLGAGGTGYVANDTGTISTGSADATYKVLTVGGGGAVLTFQITGVGTSYATGNLVATARGGAQPGVGTGFTVNITAVTHGDGTLKVITYYQVVPVP